MLYSRLTMGVCFYKVSLSTDRGYRAMSQWSQLMAKAQQGDNRSYSQLLTELLQYLKPYVLGKVKRDELADDIIQNVLLSIHNARHTFNTEKDFKPWLMAIVNNRILDYWRKHKRKFEKEVSIDNFSLDGAASDITNIELELFEKALTHLNENQKAIFKLINIDGLSIPEVAKQLQMTESAVRVNAHRSFKRIQKEFL